ncbi:MAG: hypothetical protein EXX96DRAFT_592421 [Benjaminiella poitrasii]|nr:MAG: hypothetical protein EXX96DRAFT_592421 [Benjaminiella poitrasii]
MLDDLEAEINGNGDFNNRSDYYEGKENLSPLENLDSTYRLPNSLEMVMDSRPFMPETMNVLKGQLSRVETIFANAFCGGSRVIALRQMKSHLRDQVTFANTVWKDMVRQERKNQDTKLIEPTEIKPIKCPPLLFYSVLIVLVIVKNYCFALLIFCAIMWATEAIPLYATSCLIPFMIVPMQSCWYYHDASRGFALAAALSKYGVAKAFASHVLSRAGTRPMWVLLAIMFVSGFLSMFISNVATPVLCFSLIDPILRTLPDKSRVAPCLILGIALSSCIGGMTSPISSPQNIVTIQSLILIPVGSLVCTCFAVAILTMFICWGLLLLVYRPARKITWQQIFVVLITLITIALWCAETSIEYAIVIQVLLLPFPSFFFGTGILNKEDLNTFVCRHPSGLLEDIALRLKDGIADFTCYCHLAIFSFLILSLPPLFLIRRQNLPVPHPNLLVMGAGLACSAGMGLPVSGSFGKPLVNKRFHHYWYPYSIISTALIFTLGYGIMSGMGY